MSLAACMLLSTVLACSLLRCQRVQSVPSSSSLLESSSFWCRASVLCSSSTFFMDFEKACARARTFCMVSSKLELKLKCFIWFRASSSSSSNFLYGFEQARAQARILFMELETAWVGPICLFRNKALTLSKPHEKIFIPKIALC